MVLDLRQTKCPLNFVKAKLALEKVGISEKIEVWILTQTESALNLPESLRKEGQYVELFPPDADGKQILSITRLI